MLLQLVVFFALATKGVPIREHLFVLLTQHTRSDHHVQSIIHSPFDVLFILRTSLEVLLRTRLLELLNQLVSHLLVRGLLQVTHDILHLQTQVTKTYMFVYNYTALLTTPLHAHLDLNFLLWRIQTTWLHLLLLEVRSPLLQHLVRQEPTSPQINQNHLLGPLAAQQLRLGCVEPHLGTHEALWTGLLLEPHLLHLEAIRVPEVRPLHGNHVTHIRIGLRRATFFIIIPLIPL